MCPHCGKVSTNDEWEHSEVTYYEWCPLCGGRSDMRDLEVVQE